MLFELAVNPLHYSQELNTLYFCTMSTLHTIIANSNRNVAEEYNDTLKRSSTTTVYPFIAHASSPENFTRLEVPQCAHPLTSAPT